MKSKPAPRCFEAALASSFISLILLLQISACASPPPLPPPNRAEHQRSLERIRKATTAIEANPANATAYSNRSAAKYRIGDYTGALSDANSALKLKPTDAKALANRAAAKYALADASGAVADAQEALRLDPTIDAARDTLRAAQDYLKGYPPPRLESFGFGPDDLAPADDPRLQDALRKAFTRADDLVLRHPEDAEAYLDRAIAKANLDDFAGAVDDATQAIRIDNKHDRAYLVRSVAKRHLGDLAGSRNDQNTAEAIFTENEFNQLRQSGSLRTPAIDLSIREDIPPPAAPEAAVLVEVMRRAIAAFIYYPSIAIENGLQGTVFVHLIIDPHGRILDAKIHTSSGHAVLDRAALLTVKAMSPLPLTEPLSRVVTVRMPIQYRL